MLPLPFHLGLSAPPSKTKKKTHHMQRAHYTSRCGESLAWASLHSVGKLTVQKRTHQKKKATPLFTLGCVHEAACTSGGAAKGSTKAIVSFTYRGRFRCLEEDETISFTCSWEHFKLFHNSLGRYDLTESIHRRCRTGNNQTKCAFVNTLESRPLTCCCTAASSVWTDRQCALKEGRGSVKEGRGETHTIHIS